MQMDCRDLSSKDRALHRTVWSGTNQTRFTGPGNVSDVTTHDQEIGFKLTLFSPFHEHIENNSPSSRQLKGAWPCGCSLCLNSNCPYEN